LLDQLQGEFDTLTRAKAMASSDREKKSLDSQLFRINERMDDLEDHLVPLAKRKAEIVKEIAELRSRVEEAERVLEQGGGMAKAEAVRQVCPEIVLFFGKEKRGTKVFAPFLPDKTEFRATTNSEVESKR